MAHVLVVLGAVAALAFVDLAVCIFLGRAIHFGDRPIPDPPAKGKPQIDGDEHIKLTPVIMLQPMRAQGDGNQEAVVPKEKLPGSSGYQARAQTQAYSHLSHEETEK